MPPKTITNSKKPPGCARKPTTKAKAAKEAISRKILQPLRKRRQKELELSKILIAVHSLV
jgi:hypothetical protein